MLHLALDHVKAHDSLEMKNRSQISKWMRSVHTSLSEFSLLELMSKLKSERTSEKSSQESSSSISTKKLRRRSEEEADEVEDKAERSLLMELTGEYRPPEFFPKELRGELSLELFPPDDDRPLRERESSSSQKGKQELSIHHLPHQQKGIGVLSPFVMLTLIILLFPSSSEERDISFTSNPLRRSAWSKYVWVRSRTYWRHQSSCRAALVIVRRQGRWSGPFF